MSATIATFEKVQSAVEELQRLNLKPTVSRVRERVGGGSRSNIVAHMQELFRRTAEARPPSDIAEAFLTLHATKLVEAVWAQALQIAAADCEQRMNSLMDINAGIAAGLQELHTENKSLEDRLEKAEARAIEAEECARSAEASLAARDEFESHLLTLSKVINKLRDEPPLEPGMFAVMLIVSENPGALSRDALHRRMLARGHESQAARGARSHTVQEGYVEERGAPSRLFLTAKGHARLQKEANEAKFGSAVSTAVQRDDH